MRGGIAGNGSSKPRAAWGVQGGREMQVCYNSGITSNTGRLPFAVQKVRVYTAGHQIGSRHNVQHPAAVVSRWRTKKEQSVMV